ncbi:MAG: hypothetical protein NC419_12385 [Muribaculaceae bacterium]|nr:hypothetical protein [Muribaculaceae bacterium]
MRMEVNGIQVACNSTLRQQDKNAVVVMEKEDYAAMHDGARLDIEKIAQAAGVEMRKTARIAARRGMVRQQVKGLGELNKLLKEIREVQDRESLVTQTGIATGYANAMSHFCLISEDELKDVIEVIGQAGESAVKRIENAKRHFWSPKRRFFWALRQQ